MAIRFISDKAFLAGTVLFATMVFCACGPEVVYSENQKLPGYWSYADSIAFEYEIVDTSISYDLELEVAHTDAFATQNLYTRFVTVYPNGLRQSEQVSIELADKFGDWLGSCKGADCVLNLPIQQGARFPDPGKYGLVLHQYGRRDSLEAISGLGLKVVKARSSN